MARSVKKRATRLAIPKRSRVSPDTATGSSAHKTAEVKKAATLTPRNVKKFIGVAKIVGPIVAPFALKAASAVRESYDRMRARRLGVPVDELGRFTGKGATLHARIAGDADTLQDLRARAAGRSDKDSIAAEEFADATGRRLAQLTSAVRAAERMPSARRRATHRAVSGELARIEDDLLKRLGV